MTNLTEARIREIIREEVRAVAREVVADALAGAFAKIQRGPSKLPLSRCAVGAAVADYRSRRLPNVSRGET